VAHGKGQTRRIGAIALNLVVVGMRRLQLPSIEQLKSLRWWADHAQVSLMALIATCALALWNVSLNMVNISQMNDLGLVSVLPIGCFVALGGLTLGFCLALVGVREREHPIALTIYLLALIFMLYATPALIEQAPRFQVTYWLAGHTEYLLRTGSVNRFLDAYFNWPGFFVLTGLFTSASGLTSVLALAPWASFVYNLFYLAPLYLIYTSATRDRRLVWLGLWIFYITDWIWQDYFSPQGLNLFIYLVIIAILLKWFRTSQGTPQYITVWTTEHSRLVSVQTRPLMIASRLRQVKTRVITLATSVTRPMDALKSLSPQLRAFIALSDTPLAPEQRRQRIALLVTLIGIFAFSVVSHPITPFFALLSVTALVLFGQCTPRWLPFLMAAMIVGWDFTVAWPYMAGHLSSDLAAFGNIQVAASANVTKRIAVGSAEHQFIAQTRILMTAAVGCLAILGAALRWRRGALWYVNDSSWGFGSLFAHDLPYISLAIMPFFMIVTQPYGGEMAMRSNLLSLPAISFFAAAALCTPVTSKFSRAFTITSTVVTAIICLILLTGFMFARYGNERADYITYDEFNAVAYLYSVAPPDSLLLQGWTGTPWRYKDLEQYDYSPIYTRATPSDAAAIEGVMSAVSHTQYPAAYVIITRSQKAQAEMFYSMPASSFDSIERTLLASGKFVLVYRNPDADILMYVRPRKVNVFATRPFSATPICRGYWQ
jgi:hypothetical protein